MILVIPPMGNQQYWIPVSDMRHDFDANLSWDTVGARGGAFALCPPGWQGLLPEGVKRIDMGTPLIWMLPRFAVNGAADVPRAAELQKQVRLVPLSQWGATEVPRPKPNPADFPRFTRAELTNAKAYFTTLNTLLRLSPRTGHPMDAAMEGWLREIGMDPAAKFDWEKLSPQTQRGLERATADAHRIIAERMPRVMPTVNNWQVIRLDRRMSGDPMIAAAGAMLGLLWNPREVNTYDLTFFDGSAAPLDGNKRYVLKFSTPAAGRCLLVGDDVLGRNADVRTQSHRPLLAQQPNKGHRVRQGRIVRDLPPGRRADRSQGAGELAPRAQRPLLPRHPPLFAARADPLGRLDAAAGDRPLRSVNSSIPFPNPTRHEQPDYR
jgi:hypothetical protein